MEFASSNARYPFRESIHLIGARLPMGGNNPSHVMKTLRLIILAFAFLLPSAWLHADSVVPASYSYDLMDRLLQVNYGDGRQINYTYDEMGNITSIKTRNASPPVIMVGTPLRGTVNVLLADYTVPVNTTTGILGYKATGLPPGLKFNAGIAMNTDGELPGTLYGTPTAGGVFKVLITARNITGTSSTALLVVTIENPFTAVSDGYKLSGTTNNVYGFVAPSSIAGTELGGELNLKVAVNGSFSGTLKLGVKSWPISGQFNPVSGVAATITILRPGTTTLTLNLALGLTGASRGSVTGTLGDIGMNTADVTAATHVWNATHKASIYSGASSTRYNVGLPLNAAQSATTSIPQGSGYCSIVVGTTGVATIAGVLSDGTAFSKAPMMWEDGTVPVFVLLYANKGYVAGTLALSSGLDLLATADNGVTGDLEWVRPGTSGQVYPSGFTADLDPVGGAYVAPATGYRVLDLGKGVTHVPINLVLSKGWLGGDITSALTISTANVVTSYVPNSNALSLALVKTTGTFSGKFTASAPTRVVSYKGMLVPAAGTAEAAGHGWFLMPETTPTSAQRSGKVLIARP